MVGTQTLSCAWPALLSCAVSEDPILHNTAIQRGVIVVMCSGIIVGAPTWNTGADEARSGTAWDDVLEEIKGKLMALLAVQATFLMLPHGMYVCMYTCMYARMDAHELS